MNAEYPILAEHLAQHHWRGSTLGCECRWNWPKERNYFCGEDERIAEMHRKHQAATWREACTIRTAEQVLNLPTGVVLHSADDGPVELFSDGHWYLPGRRDAISFRRVLDNLPAQLIWHPEWIQP